ncbi:hypothetical protein [Streptomyces sp. NPDC014623]
MTGLEPVADDGATGTVVHFRPTGHLCEASGSPDALAPVALP